MAAEPNASFCTQDETTLFNCQLQDNKAVSLCASKQSPQENGYLQYRYGRVGERVEMLIPRTRSGIPKLELVQHKDSYLEYNKVAIQNPPWTYKIESYRRFKKLKNGYPTHKNADSLAIEDDRKSVFEGNVTYSSECATVGDPVDAVDISKMTDIKLQ